MCITLEEKEEEDVDHHFEKIFRRRRHLSVVRLRTSLFFSSPQMIGV